MPRPIVRSAVSCAVLTLCGGALHAQTSPAPAGAASAPVQTLEKVVVRASADASAEGLKRSFPGGQVARGGRMGLLGNQDVMDTPFNITNYTQELIQNQQAASVGEVLQNDPSVRVARGFGNFQQVYIVRGFPVYSDDMAYNGLYGLLPRQYLSAELIERVEVLRGANTFLNGAAPGGSGIGGAINIIPKRALNEDLTQATVGIETGGQTYLAADLSRRFGPDRSSGIRLNVARRDGDTAIDREQRETGLVAIGLDHRARDWRVSADVGYQDHRLDATRPSVTPGPLLTAVPTPPDASANFSQPWTYSYERDLFGTVRGEFDLSDTVTAWAAIGARQGDEDNDLASPTVLNAAGDMSTYRFTNARRDTIATGEVGVRASLRTGSVGHTLVASAAVYDGKERNAFGMSDFAGFPGNLYRPVDAPPPAYSFVGGDLNNPLVVGRVKTRSLAVADTLAFADERVLLILGARHQTLENHVYDYNTGVEDATQSYDKSRVSPAVGLVVKPSERLSLYANYVESLAKGPTAPSGTQNVGEVFDPYVSKQTEIGAKFEWERLGASVAVFSTDKPNSRTVNNVFGVVGEQRNRGVEFSLYGEAARGVRVLGGLTLLRTKIVDTGDATTEGKQAIGVPKTQLNIGGEWDVAALRGLTLTGRAVYTSSQQMTATNSLALPSWTRLDLGARYLTSIGDQLLTLRAAINNVTDRDYWASSGGSSSNYLVLGDPRTVVLSASLEF